MKNPFVFIFLLVVTAFAGCRPTGPSVSGTAILITNAHVIDVMSGNVEKDRAILIDSGKIVSIGDGSELSALV